MGDEGDALLRWRDKTREKRERLSERAQAVMRLGSGWATPPPWPWPWPA